MEQTLSEVISLESVPVASSTLGNNNNANINNAESASQTDRMYLSYASSVNGGNSQICLSESKSYSWTFEMQIWLLIVELFLKLDQVRHYHL